ncbi:dihydrodipicolinate synthase family protein [Alienimonas californiensis]|uniref:4-hydroxy-tetrahydrodipicolinate synthase n=1 Tax=Alienimonas californiensis TaxID=2527989 RepID=A0A517PAB4_9PLAN|nr:dihydrodipicolinate synthase family protein [Alienimonas californiensis]QDT16305.1 4-hydroxy-tetrahydrodipicolinate synthase [Alienimonas californiensis]
MSVPRPPVDARVFRGCMPALMTPCGADGVVNYEALVRKGLQMTAAGMTGVVYCGSMGDWPLLTDQQRQEGVARLVEAGVPVVVGTGAQNSALAVAHAEHAAAVGAAGLMAIPRVLSRGASPAAQRNHFDAILAAAPDLPTVIYNSPYYGFETKAELFFELRRDHANLVGFKEFGGAASLSYAAEHITSADDDLLLLAGVDTQVYHGFVRCGAAGAITGIGNCLPREVLTLVCLCKAAAGGDPDADRCARELAEALAVLSRFDEEPDLVLHYKYLLFLTGDADYEHQLNVSDRLSPSQARYAEAQLRRFQAWWERWPGKEYDARPAAE